MVDHVVLEHVVVDREDGDGVGPVVHDVHDLRVEVDRAEPMVDGQRRDVRT